jgi:hypothetical protein
MTDLSVVLASALSETGNFGKTASTIKSSESNTPPTKKKYRTQGISVSLHPREARGPPK